jgi:hypothetical protein
MITDAQKKSIEKQLFAIEKTLAVQARQMDKDMRPIPMQVDLALALAVRFGYFLWMNEGSFLHIVYRSATTTALLRSEQHVAYFCPVEHRTYATLYDTVVAIAEDILTESGGKQVTENGALVFIS